MLNEERQNDRYLNGQEIFVVFEDPDCMESLEIFEIPYNNPDEKYIKGTSTIYRLAEQMAKKHKLPTLIFKYIYQDNELVNGEFIRAFD